MLKVYRLLNFGICFLLLALALECSVGKVSCGITSSYVRSEFPAEDIPLDDPAFAVPKDPNAPQQVHITQGDYDGKAVIISWVMMNEPGSNEVLYGISENNYSQIAQGIVTNYTFYNYKSGYIHHCVLDGLQPDTKYYYKLGTDNSSREFSFQTPPEINPDATYTFGIIGDLGQTYNSLTTLDHYVGSAGQAVWYVGDLSYADDYDECSGTRWDSWGRFNYDDCRGTRWDSWGRLIERSAAYQPWIWTIGNHEIEYEPDLGEVFTFKAFLHRYATPYAASGSSDPLYYAIRRASAHIIVLSSYSPFVKYSPQYHWLKKELKRVDREQTPWLIVLMHAPIYNSNKAHHEEGVGMKSVFEHYFVKYKVDIVFAGHVHAYERWYRVSEVEDSLTSGLTKHTKAPAYITVGDGGNQEGLAEKFLSPQPEKSAFREASYGHSTLELRNRTHAFYYWNRNEDGKNVTVDRVTFHNQHWTSSTTPRRMKKEHQSHDVDIVTSTY